MFSSSSSSVTSTLSSLNAYRRVLYVGNLSPQATRDVLYNLFISFGEVLDVIIPTQSGSELQKQLIDSNGGIIKHKGYAFVEFELPEDAKEALENMNNSELFGRVITVNYSKATNLSKEAFSDLNVPLWTLEEGAEKKQEEIPSSSITEEEEPTNPQTTLPEPSTKKTKLS